MRQREFAERKPRHFCPVCTALVYGDDEDCLDCGSARGEAWPDLNESMDPFLGRVIDSRYLITRLIGQGGTGKVYRAVSFGVAREFAVKLIEAQGANAAKTRERLEREIDAMSRMRNPHVVPFYEIFEIYDHFLGVVMDYVPGNSLQTLVEIEGPLNPIRVARLFLQVANGLQEAHTIGIVHRDVKPDNLMVEALPASGDFVHILDFGIVRFADADRTSNLFVGTPLYASPEQVRDRKVDTRADIYALGCSMYFALVGRPPFWAARAHEVMELHCSAPRPELPDHVPARLRTLVTRCMARDPQERPGSMRDVVTALREVAEQPTTPTLSNILEGDRRSVRKDLENARTRSRHSASDTSSGKRFSVGVAMPADARLWNCHGELLVGTPHDLFRLRGQALERLGTTSAMPSAMCMGSLGVFYGTQKGEVLRASDNALLYNDLRHASVNTLCMRAQGKVLVAGFESGRVTRLDDAKDVWKPVISGPPVVAVVCSPSGSRAVVAYKTREIEVFDNTSFRVPTTSFSVPEGIRSVSLSSDGHIVAVLMNDTSLGIYQATDGRLLTHMRIDAGAQVVSFQANGTLLVYWVQGNELWAEVCAN